MIVRALDRLCRTSFVLILILVGLGQLSLAQQAGANAKRMEIEAEPLSRGN